MIHKRIEENIEFLKSDLYRLDHKPLMNVLHDLEKEFNKFMTVDVPLYNALKANGVNMCYKSGKPCDCSGLCRNSC